MWNIKRILITENQYKFLLEQTTSVNNIVDGIWKSVNGVGTDEETFFNLLSQIKDQKTLNLVDSTLKNKYKEGFYEIINDMLEFTPSEKTNIVKILTTNKLPHYFNKYGKILPKQVIPNRTVKLFDPETLKPSNNLVKFLMYEEGDPKIKGEPMLVSYRKSGDVWTIGYGHTMNVKGGMKITKNQAIKLLMQDITEHEKCVKGIFADWKKNGINVNVTQSMYDTLISLSFNSGCGSIRGSSSKNDMIDYVKTKEFYYASEKIKTFNLKKGFSGLITRRQKESQMFCSQGGCVKPVSS